MEDSELQYMAEQAVKATRERPDFGYSGELPLGKTWALTFGRTRDSAARESHDFERTRKSMEKKHPGQVEVVRSRHWATGWVEELAVRMLDDQGRVTDAGKDAILREMRARGEEP